MNGDTTINDVSTQTYAESGASWLTLFVSSGTLICCALPIILITSGLGATVAALTNSFPVLITLSLHKVWVFAGSGAMLLLTGWLTYRPDLTCPTDPELRRVCSTTRVWNRRLYLSSLLIWGIGFFAAYLALPLLVWLGP